MTPTVHFIKKTACSSLNSDYENMLDDLMLVDYYSDTVQMTDASLNTQILSLLLNKADESCSLLNRFLCI
jgi:hypothetical protein